MKSDARASTRPPITAVSLVLPRRHAPTTSGAEPRETAALNAPAHTETDSHFGQSLGRDCDEGRGSWGRRGGRGPRGPPIIRKKLPQKRRLFYYRSLSLSLSLSAPPCFPLSLFMDQQRWTSAVASSFAD